MIQASIIIINYNTHQLTLDCLTSFYKLYKSEDFEVIVVDNASNLLDYQKLQQEIREHFADVQLVRSRINLGFGGGNMHGIQWASAPHYVFVNSDVLFVEDCLHPMLNYLKEHDEVSIVGCSSRDEHHTPYKAFDYRLSFWSELLSDSVLHRCAPKKYPNRKEILSQPLQVGGVPGSLFAVKSADFNAVGGFDTHLFLYYEEKELALRVHKILNKQCVSLPQYHYIHLKGKSTVPSLKIAMELKISQFYALKKHLGWFTYKVFYCLITLKTLLKAPFSKKNSTLLGLLLSGISVAQSMKNEQKILND